MVWFAETFRLVQLSDFIGMPGLWVLACSEGADLIVATFYGQFFNLKKEMLNIYNHVPYISARLVYVPKKSKANTLKLIICLCPVVHILKSYACPNYKLMVL